MCLTRVVMREEPQDSVMSYLDRGWRESFLSREVTGTSKFCVANRLSARWTSTATCCEGIFRPFAYRTVTLSWWNLLVCQLRAYGLLRQPARYEFRGEANGKELLTYALPMNGVSHVSVGGMRNGEPFNVYVTLTDFRNLHLEDGDRVEFVADTRGKTIMVAASGAIHGASRFPVLKQTRLKTLLAYISVEPELADIKSIYIRRKSVAAEQKVILKDALRRLEQSALTATSASVDEASIRVKEAELIQNFVQRASKLEPDGVLVVSRKGSSPTCCWRKVMKSSFPVGQM